MPERFSVPFPPGFAQAIEEIDSGKHKKVGLTAFRGCGKTTALTIGLPAKKLCYKDIHYFVPVEATNELAVAQSENLKQELMENPMIQKVFDLPPSKMSEDKWIIGDSCIQPRGAGQSIRGMLFKYWRPDWITLDDLETDQSVQSSEERRKLKNWVFQAIERLPDQIANAKWSIIAVGSMLHEDCLLQWLKDSSDWKFLSFPIANDDLVSNWPERFTTEDIQKQVQNAKSKGMLDSWYIEMMCQITSKASGFSGLIRTYEESGLNLTNSQYIVNVMIIDPAKSSLDTSSEYAAVIAAVDVMSRAIYYRDILHGHFEPGVFQEKALDLAQQYKVRVIGIENEAAGDHILYPFKNEMSLRRMFDVDVVPIKCNKRSKEDRTAAMLPMFKQGLVFFNGLTCPALMAQYMSFPKNAKWDLIDAASHILKLLEQEELYFLPPEQRHIDEVNSLRKESGLPPIAYKESEDAKAQNAMAARDMFGGHTLRQINERWCYC